MKIKRIILILFIACSYSLNAQDKWFDKFAEMDGITSVYISSTMLKMMPNMNVSGLDIGNLAMKLEMVQILTSEKPEIAKQMRKETSHFAKDKSYEQLMKVKDEATKVNFYIKKKDTKIRELIMLVDEDSEFVIIQLVGDFTLQDIQELSNMK